MIAHIERANAESKRKSDLAQANWKQKRRIASKDQMLTTRAPAWLKIEVHKVNNRVVSREVSVIPEAAETVRLIFKLKLDGFGKFAIERKLNQTAPWSPPKSEKRETEGWRASYIEKIMRSRAVNGEFQPHRLQDGKRVPDGEPLPGYFPVVIKPQTFHAVQARMAGNGGTNGNGGGRTGKATNVFQNLVKCGYCGGSMVLVDKGNKGGKSLVCDNGRRGVEITKKDDEGNETKSKCRAHSVPYSEFEDTMLNNLAKLRPETVLPNPDEQAAQSKQLQNTIAGLAGELSDTESRVSNLVDQIERTSNVALRTRYEQRAGELESKKPELEAEQARLEAALKELERGEQDFAKWQKNLAGLKKAVAEDVDTRVRLKTHLKQFIVKVDVFAKGHEENVEHALAIVEEFMPELERAKSYPAFKRYLRQRCLSSEGRFYKLHLRTALPDSERKGRVYQRSAGFQIAPANSLSAGVSIKPGKDGLRFTRPKLDMLLKEFFDGRKQGFVPKASVS